MGTVRYTTINGEVISQTRDGVRSQFVPDPLGNTVALLDDTQTITDTFSYFPYGEVASRTGDTVTPFQYVGTRGYYTDAPSRSYVRARYLDSTAGRWITQDPIGFRGGLNRYRYSESNPVKYVDPTGLDVTIVFDKKSGTLKIFDNQLKIWSEAKAFSGNEGVTDPTEPSGPIPNGTYIILPAKNAHPNEPFSNFIWYPLNGCDKHGQWVHDNIPVP